jgi:hypothetical protein
MSSFNDANELASNLVFGINYHDNKPIDNRPKRLVFTLTKTVTITADAETHEVWAKVAGEIQDALDEGYGLKLDKVPCGPACYYEKGRKDGIEDL